METGNQIELNNKVEKFIALLLFALIVPIGYILRHKNGKRELD